MILHLPLVIPLEDSCRVPPRKCAPSFSFGCEFIFQCNDDECDRKSFNTIKTIPRYNRRDITWLYYLKANPCYPQPVLPYNPFFRHLLSESRP